MKTYKVVLVTGAIVTIKANGINDEALLLSFRDTDWSTIGSFPKSNVVGWFQEVDEPAV